jgi:hypothetical protein
VANSSIDRSTVDLDKGEMSFGLFDYGPEVELALASQKPSLDKMEALVDVVGDAAFPKYLRSYIQRVSPQGSDSVAVHEPISIAGYTDADKDRIYRKKGFIGKNQMRRAKSPNAVHHIFVIHNGHQKAKIFYKFEGSIQFIRNTAHDQGV